MYYVCRNTGIIDTCAMQILYTCNILKTPHVYYCCGTIGHIDN